MEGTYYHTCGHPIILVLRGEGAGTAAIFYDGEQPLSDEADSIYECPGCGETLLFGDLMPEPKEEWW